MCAALNNDRPTVILTGINSNLQTVEGDKISEGKKSRMEDIISKAKRSLNLVEKREYIIT